MKHVIDSRRDSKPKPISNSLGLRRLNKELRILLLMSVPMVASYLSSLIMTITDVVTAGRLGSVELGAVSLVGNLLSDFFLVCTGIVSIVSLLVGQAHGANDRRAVREGVRQGFWVATVLSILGVLLLYRLGPLLTFIGQDREVIQYVNAYLQGAVWSALPILWFAVLRSFVTALSQVLPIVIITIAGASLNLVLNSVLTFGLFGFPEFGVAGIGYSTGIVSWIMLIALIVHIFRSQLLREYRVFSNLGRLNVSVCWDILKLGLPVAGIILLETGMFSTISILMGVLSVSDLAANQIVLTVVDTVTVVAFAIGEAATIRVAQGIGMGKVRLSYQTSYLAIALGTGVMASIALLMWIIPQSIVSLFIDVNDPANAQVLHLATTLFGIAAIFQIFDGIQAITTRVLKGFQDTVVPLWIGIIGYWLIAVGGGYVLAFPLKMGGAGLWLGLAGGLAVTAILLVWRFRWFTQSDMAQELV